MTKLLCDHGVDLEDEDMIGRNALHFAIKNGNKDMIKMLLYYGARPWSNRYF